MRATERFERTVKRVVAAVPDATLAWACYVGATDTLAGNEPGFYLYGLLIVELMSVAWMRVVLAPTVIGRSTSTLRTILGIGGTGIAIFMLFINGIMVLILFVFIMFFDPRAFLLLLLALTRRSLWLWCWGIRSPENATLLHDHTSRITRAHYLAVLVALGVAVLANQYLALAPEAQTTLSDALYLAAMAGYFTSLALYMVVGSTPLPDETDNSGDGGIADLPPLAPLDLSRVVLVTVQNWFRFIPGVALIWFAMGIVWAAIPEGGQVVMAPLGIGASAWYLVGGACVALGYTSEGAFAFGYRRLSSMAYAMFGLWMIVLFLLFFSIPFSLGVLGHDVSTEPMRTPALDAMFLLCGLGICYVVARLWPVLVLAFLDSEELRNGASYKFAWQLTAGVRGFINGAMPPVLAVLLLFFVMAILVDYPLVARLVVYLVLAPLIAVLAIERAAAMLLRWRACHGEAEPEPAEAAEPSNPDDPPLVIPVPIPVPIPQSDSPSSGSFPSAADRRDNRGAAEPGNREHYYSDQWSAEDKFLSAAYNQDTVTMESMLEQGVDIDARGDGDVALLYAARMGKPGSVRYLLDKGGDVYARAITGATVLHYAACFEELATFLPELKTWWETVDVPDNRGRTPLMDAVAAGCIPCARSLIELGANPLTVDKGGCNMIYVFVDGLGGFRKGRSSAENLALLGEFLEMGIDPLQVGQFGQHAVSIAGHKGLTEVLDVFQQHGVDVAQPDANGFTAMSGAALNRKFDAVHELERQGVEADFVSAVSLGRLAAVADYLADDPGLLNRGTGSLKITPLAFAIYHGHKPMVEFLLSRGADIPTSKAFGGSVLHNAVRNLPDLDLLQELIDSGATVDAIDGDLNTPLNFAAREDAVAAARLLLENGADPGACTERGYPVKQFARSDEMRDLLAAFGGP